MKLLLFIFSLPVLAGLSVVDPYRAEIREIILKEHQPLTDWREAKRHLMQNIYLESDESGYFIKDVYCHRIIRKSVGPDKMPYGETINIEHTWPQSKFTKKKSKVQKSDLHHLFPTDTYVNNLRANFYFSDLPNSRSIEGCEISKKGYNHDMGKRAFEPPAKHKGNIARALFYFAVRYNARIHPGEEIFLRLWNALDPVDDQERRRNDIIESIQGNRNIFIDEPEYADLISDF